MVWGTIGVEWQVSFWVSIRVERVVIFSVSLALTVVFQITENHLAQGAQGSVLMAYIAIMIVMLHRRWFLAAMWFTVFTKVALGI